MVNFTSDRQQLEILRQVADRADELGIGYKRMDMLMDLDAANSNGQPLDFARLLDFPDFDFTHDICGIQRHIDRTTGKLGDCFIPRCAKIM